MYPKVDYTNARNPGRLSGGVAACYLAYLKLTGISSRDYFLDPLACSEMYRKGRVLLRDMFGDCVHPGPLLTPYIAYGHLSGLGAKLTFPDEGEVGVEPLYASLDEGIRALQKPMDFGRAGMAQFYVEFHQKMKAQFTDEKIGFGYSNNGPLTSAYLLRGSDILLDLYDEPEKIREFLRLLVDSMIQFNAWKIRYSGGKTSINPSGAGLADDLASLISPALWPEFVLPYWDQWYHGVTTGSRSAHCENLTADHLPHLETIGLISYDPFVSSKLDPEIIAVRCRVPFTWGLPSFRFGGMQVKDVADFVFAAAAAGSESVYTHVEGPMCNSDAVPKVLAFARAFREASEHIKQGKLRQQLAENVSRPDYWSWWRSGCAN